MTTAGAAEDSGRRLPVRRLLAVAAPLIVVGIAAVLWLISDRLLFVGPLDRATFGWSVVIPLWAAAPLAAGFGWQYLPSRARRLAAVVCGLVVGAPLAFVMWQGTAFPACQFGSARGPANLLLPAIIVGVAVGGGLGLNTLAASAQVRAGHRWQALIFGGVAQLAVILVAFGLTFQMFFGICQRP
jgi:hypothetical protein